LAYFEGIISAFVGRKWGWWKVI